MKKGALKFVFVTLFLLPVCVNATIVKDFYTDGQIVDGNYFDIVNIWDTATVGMTGGTVGNSYLYNMANLNCYGGVLFGLEINNNATATILNLDYIGGIGLKGSGKLHIYDGGSGSSVSVQIFDNAELHVYGISLELIMPTSQGTSGGVKGHWVDGQSFFIGFRNAGNFDPLTQVFLHEIPEPSAIALLGLLALFVRKRGN